MTNLATLRPPGAPFLGDPDPIAPGPLSPAWPRPALRTPPANPWAALVEDFEAIRQEALAALRGDAGGFWFLTAEERARIEAGVAAMRRDFDGMEFRLRNGLDDLPTPVLPTTRIFGARDVADILATAIRVAAFLSDHA